MFKKISLKPYIVVLSFLKNSLAEIARNFLLEKEALDRIFKLNKLQKYQKDFMYIAFVNESDKVYRVIFQILLKQKPKDHVKYIKAFKQVFMCTDVELVNKLDFKYENYQIKEEGVNAEKIKLNSFGYTKIEKSEQEQQNSSTKIEYSTKPNYSEKELNSFLNKNIETATSIKKIESPFEQENNSILTNNDLIEDDSFRHVESKPDAVSQEDIAYQEQINLKQSQDETALPTKFEFTDKKDLS